MAYKIGTRVKKVRGVRNIGITGVVVPVPDYYLHEIGDGWNMCVKMDSPWVNVKENICTSTKIAAVKSEHYEPITPNGHRAGVKGECSLLDELLSRENNNETVK